MALRNSPFASPFANDDYALGKYYAGVGPVLPYNGIHKVRGVAPGSISGSKKVIVGFGDSITANSTPSLATIVQANNFNLNVSDGGIYATSDPILGASNGFASPFLSSPYGPLGDLIISGSYAVNAIIAPNPMGSSKVTDWAVNGPLNRNIGIMAKRLQNAGLMPNAVIWHEGVNSATAGYTQIQYAGYLTSVIITMRLYWPSPIPILIGVCTQAASVQSSAIQAAQAAAIDHPNGIWAGVNSDAFSAGNFQDGTHFNSTGRDAWAAAAITQLHAAGAI